MYTSFRTARVLLLVLPSLPASVCFEVLLSHASLAEPALLRLQLRLLLVSSDILSSPSSTPFNSISSTSGNFLIITSPPLAENWTSVVHVQLDHCSLR